MAYHGIKIRNQKLDEYIEKHGDRWKFQVVSNTRNIYTYARLALSRIVAIFQYHCPKETGYGRQFGIRVKRVENKLTGKFSKTVYEIIIGSETPANPGQLRNAPYIAIHNILDNHTDWIDSAIRDSKKEVSRIGISCQISAPKEISKYKRKNKSKNSAGGVSGYSVTVSFVLYEMEQNKAKENAKKEITKGGRYK